MWYNKKYWLIHLLQIEKKSYSSIHSIRGVLRPAFQLAVDDDLIRKNPFQFQLMEVVVNDSVTREAISRAEERKFLRFVKEDPHFCRYYEGINEDNQRNEKDTYDCGCRGMLSENNRKTKPVKSRTYGRWKKWILIL